MKKIAFLTFLSFVLLSYQTSSMASELDVSQEDNPKSEITNDIDEINDFSLISPDSIDLSSSLNDSAEISTFSIEASDLLAQLSVQPVEDISPDNGVEEYGSKAYAGLISQTDADNSNENDIPGEFSGTVGFTTNYLFRGISQTDNEVAIQGSLDYSVDVAENLGLYAGVWGSNIDFGDEADFGGASLGTIEIDLYGGASYAISDIASIGGSIAYYSYPGASSSLDFDNIEFGLDGSYDFDAVSTTLNFAYSPDFFGGSGDSFYVAGGFDVPLPQNFSISGGLGFQAIGENDTFGTPDYLEWNFGLNYEIAGFDLQAQYADTDLSESECFGGSNLCQSRVVFSISRSF